MSSWHSRATTASTPFGCSMGFSGTPTSTRCGRLRLYDEAVRQALIVFWEASDRICGKRLKPLLPVLLPALERHGHISLDPAVRTQLLVVNASTIDRMLSGARASTGGRRARAKTTPAVRRRVPVRTFADWHDPAPGFVEADLVHCGESMAGSFASTLVLTDIASGWIECIALLVREASLIVDALERLRVTLPFPLRDIDTDNGSEFINELLIMFCTDHGIEFTRSRPYRKNDQAWVEQKNGSVVRRLVGYGRLEGVAAGEAALAALLGLALVRELLPALVQARKEQPGRGVGRGLWLSVLDLRRSAILGQQRSHRVARACDLATLRRRGGQILPLRNSSRSTCLL